MAAPTLHAAAPTPAERYKSVDARQPGGCPSLRDVDIDRLTPDEWKDPPRAMPFHAGMRLAAGVPVPHGNPAVFISWSGGHHETVGGSVVAVRDKTGAWQVDGVDTFKSLVPPASGATGSRPTTVKHNTWTLPDTAGRRLDGLIASPCTRAEPRIITYFHPQKGGGKFMCVGGATLTVEVIQGRDRIASVQSCGQWGAFGQIRQAVFEGAPRN